MKDARLVASGRKCSRSSCRVRCGNVPGQVHTENPPALLLTDATWKELPELTRTKSAGCATHER